MFELMGIIFVAVLVAMVAIEFAWRKWNLARELAEQRITDEWLQLRKNDLINAAGGEYLNWSKAKRILFEDEHSNKDLSENTVQETPGNYASSAPSPSRDWSKEINKYFVENRDLINKINDKFVEKRLVEAKDFFDQRDLTHAQRLSVVRDEDANLINAGAGSGKTRTIVSKVEYLITRRLALPSEILVVAYNKKIQHEIAEKIKKISPGVAVSTFHALGRKIVSDVEGRTPRLSELATNEIKLGRFLLEKMREIMKNFTMINMLVEFFSARLFESNPEDGVKTKDEYLRKIRPMGIFSIDGTRLRSHQEVEIANWLTLSGIEWEYEKCYPHASSTRQYNPDFYLPDYDLWIEHFGIDESGNTAPWVNKQKYQEEMRWKRELHNKNQTRLVETYSYESRHNGGLPRALEEKLAQYKVEKKHLTDADIDDLVAEQFKPVPNFVKLINKFLMLFRENCFSTQDIESQAISGRDRVFLVLFNVFRDGYEAKLVANQEIDFTDMIVRGMKYVKNGKYRSAFKYILVDEYQDITKARLEFLLALQSQVEDARLFCVGDDWQSIYQFNGANVGLIARFGDYVGAMQRTDLDMTFRYSQKVNDFSVMFITENPAQLNKRVKSTIASDENSRPVRIVYHLPEHQKDKLQEIADTIAHQSRSVATTCFVLGRYNHDKPESWDEVKRYARAKSISMEFSTIHRAKGREADWVIVVENKSDSKGLGFPATVESDPVLRMLLPREDKFANAEERRLFYVAVTRARHGVFLLVPAGDVSAFIQEIDPRMKSEINRTSSQHKYAPFVHVENNAAARLLICPECHGQTIQKITTDDGNFFHACSHYPLCTGKLHSCNCGLAIPVVGQTTLVHVCECGEKFDICPQCMSGILVLRKGEHGDFWGCSRYGIAECRYTKRVS